MSILSIKLSDALKPFVDEQVSDRSYGTSSDYLGDLILADQDRQRLRDLLCEGAASPAIGPADDAYFDVLRDRVCRAQAG